MAGPLLPRPHFRLVLEPTYRKTDEMTGTHGSQTADIEASFYLVTYLAIDRLCSPR